MPDRFRSRFSLRRFPIPLVIAIPFLFMAPRGAAAQIDALLSYDKISSGPGGFMDTLDDGDTFGMSVEALGDIDGDGVTDLAVGSGGDEDGGPGRGAVWILLMQADGNFKSACKISGTRGGFHGELHDFDSFGTSIAALGDVDGDGIADVAVGVLGDDDGGVDRGALWVLFLNADGSVKAQRKISGETGNFGGALDDKDRFGIAMGAIGDLDGDGVPDVAVSAIGDDDGGMSRGAVWILFLNRDGTVKTEQKTSSPTLPTGALDDFDFFGSSIASPGDLDRDGVNDIAVGALGDDDGGEDTGAVWVLFMNRDGSVKSSQKISDTAGGFLGSLDAFDFFGGAVEYAGDLNGDTIGDIAVGAWRDDDGGPERGAVWLLFLNRDGTVQGQSKLSMSYGHFTGIIGPEDLFGNSIAMMGDIDHDGQPDFAIGAPGDDDGGTSPITNRGAVWMLFLNRDRNVKYHRKLSDIAGGGFAGHLDNGDVFGWSLACLGDLNLDGIEDIAVGARFDDDGGTNRGAVWILFLNDDGTVKKSQKISDVAGNFAGELDNIDAFGWSISPLGDFDGDGVTDIAVTAAWDDDGGPNRGAVWLLFLRRNGVVKYQRKISDMEGGFAGGLHDLDQFGASSAFLGDLDGDGVGDIAVGGGSDDEGGIDRGAVWILFLNADGTVKAHQKIGTGVGGFVGELNDSDQFGWSLAPLGDFDGDGVVDLAVGTLYDDDGGFNHGAVWLLYLNTDGTVKAHGKISSTMGRFGGVLSNADEFGRSVATLGDLDGNGVIDLGVGAWLDDDGGVARGAVWLLFLRRDGTVQFHQKLSSTKGTFDGALDNSDWFGSSLSLVGDMDGNGVRDLVVGAPGDDDGGFESDHGAVWTLFLETPVLPVAVEEFAANWQADHVVVTWTLTSVKPGLSVGVMRRDGGDYEPVAGPDIIEDGTMFAFHDHKARLGVTYDYQVTIMQEGSPNVVFETTVSTPSAVFELRQNHPNPFNPKTTITFGIDDPGPARLTIYDVSGARVRTLANRPFQPGIHTEEWDGTDDNGQEVSTGIYFYHLVSGNRTLSRKAVLLR